MLVVAWLSHDAHYRVNAESNLLKMSSLFLSFLGWERVPAHPRAQTSERCEAKGGSASQACCCCCLWDVSVFHSLLIFYFFSLLSCLSHSPPPPPPPIVALLEMNRKADILPSSRFLYSFFSFTRVTTTSLLKAFPWPVSRTVAK